MKIQATMFLIVTLAIMFVAGCAGTHTAPVTVPVTLQWTCTGDDGIIGTATGYDFRWSLDSLQLKNSWGTCGAIPNPPTPLVAGSAQTFTFNQSVELGVRYFYAVKVVDDAGNWSLISNITSRLWPDNMAPTPVADLRVGA